MKDNRARPADRREPSDRDWFWPMIGLSAFVHMAALVMFHGKDILHVDALIVRSMTFVHEDTVTPIRIAAVPVAPAPKETSSTEAEPLPRIEKNPEEAETVPAPAEKKDPVAEREKKMELAERVDRRAGGRNSRAPLFLQVIRERISRSCEKHVTEQVGTMGLQRIVVLSVSLLPSGELKSVEVLESSNMPVVDKASVEAVRLAAPFPELPADLKKDLETLNMSYLKLKVPIKFVIEKKSG